MREILYRGQLIKDQYDKKKGKWVYGKLNKLAEEYTNEDEK